MVKKTKATKRVIKPKQPVIDVFEKKSKEISDLYRELGEKIFNNFIDHLMKYKGVSLSKDDAFAWQIEKMREFNLINKQNIKIASLYSHRATKDIEDLFLKYGKDVYKKTQKEIKGTSKPTEDLEAVLQGFVDNAKGDLDNLVNQTLIDTNFIGKKSGGMRSVTARNMYMHIVNQATAAVVDGIYTGKQAIAETIIEWQKKNGNGGYFIDKGGHRWSFERYAYTVVTSTSYHVYNEMRTAGMKDLGLVTAYMSAHPAARPACAYIQGKVVLVVPKDEAPEKLQHYPSIYDYDYGKPAGTLGINCRHTLTPFDPELNTVPDKSEEMKGITPKKAIENGRLQERQRRLEREIKKAKELMSIAKKTGDQGTFEYAKLLLKNKRAAIRKLVDDHDFLHRDYFREKYFEKPSFDSNTVVFRDKGMPIYGKMVKRASSYDSPIFSNGRAIKADYYKLKYRSDAEAKYFRKKLQEIAGTQSKGSAVEVKSAEDYKTRQLYIAQNGKAVYALDHGDLESVSAKLHQKMGQSIVASAIDQGANKLDCYSIQTSKSAKRNGINSNPGVLPNFYGAQGFVEVARVAINPEYDDTGGQADYVSVMAYGVDVKAPKIFDENGYEDAMKYRDELLKKGKE